MQVFVGVRRSGKSYLLFQRMREKIAAGSEWKDLLYLDFEDARLDGFEAEDFNLILECHNELYGTRPTLFLDEIQNISGWEKFARNLADRKYSAYITGSNAKMLSKEIMSTLGGRYLATEVYPLSFVEYLEVKGVQHDTKAQLATDSRINIVKAFKESVSYTHLTLPTICSV